MQSILLFLAGAFIGGIVVAWFTERTALVNKIKKTETNLHERFDAIELSLKSHLGHPAPTEPAPAPAPSAPVAAPVAPEAPASA